MPFFHEAPAPMPLKQGRFLTWGSAKIGGTPPIEIPKEWDPQEGTPTFGNPQLK